MVVATGVAPTAVASPFVVRRVANPRYRPPLTTAAAIGPGVVSRLRALDHLSTQIFHHGSPGPASMSHWQLAAGEQYRSNNALELGAAGTSGPGRHQLEALRLSGRRGGFSGGLGDNEPLVLAPLVYLQRLRGSVLRYTARDQSQWMALGGVPTPVAGARTPRIALAGMATEGLHFDEAILSLTVMGFARERPPAAVPTDPSPDSLAGRGALAALAWKAPFAGGTLAGTFGGQAHDLDGPRVLALQQSVEWRFASPALAATIADQRGTRGGRLLGTDRFAPAPRREDRWNLQARFAGGRTESHFTGVLREGGDAALEARTIAWGGSGSFGKSTWYGGTDAVWDSRRAAAGVAATGERRFSVHAGGPVGRGAALLSRLEYGEHPGSGGSLSALAEASVPLRGGIRFELEPRFGWSERVLQHGQLTTRLTWPLGALGARLTGTLAAGATRDQGFRGGVLEAALALSCSPRLRDRAGLEARRLNSGGRPTMEYEASYDAIAERYETPGQWIASRDTGRVTVRVARSGNGSGAPDVLVSLDGQTLRFTDADGIARFDRVPPGIHTVAIEERALPENVEVVGSSRAFVTVERGRVADTVTFTIGRAERKTRF